MRWLIRIVRTSVACLLLSWLVLYLEQDRLLFHPQPLPAARRNALAADVRITPLSLSTHDGVVLKGWFRRPNGAGPWPVLLYFAGNADEASSIFEFSDAWPNWAVATLNYRSYGDSTGNPSESVMKADADALYDAIAVRPDIQRDQIVAFGRSLGTGVAVALAASRPIARVVLVTPYDSLPSVAEDHFPWVPANLLMRNRFDSAALGAHIASPALFIIAGQDDVIPAEHARRLFAAWKGNKTWSLIEGANHADILAQQALTPILNDFLSQGGKRASR